MKFRLLRLLLLASAVTTMLAIVSNPASGQFLTTDAPPLPAPKVELAPPNSSGSP